MASVWLDAFLGKTGNFIIKFIDTYYYYFVPIIIIYGIFLTLASYNLKRIEKNVSSEIILQARGILKQNPDVSYPDLIERIKINWEETLRKNSFFPYIAMESGLWVSKVSAYNARSIIMHNDRKIHLTLERNGIVLIEDRMATRRNLYTEYFHRMFRNQ